MQGADLLYSSDDNIPMSFGLVFTQLNWMLKLVWMVKEFTNAYSISVMQRFGLEDSH